MNSLVGPPEGGRRREKEEEEEGWVRDWKRRPVWGLVKGTDCWAETEVAARERTDALACKQLMQYK